MQTEAAKDLQEFLTSKQDVLLTGAEVARLFRVHPKTVMRWARTGKLEAIHTLGGHRRYRAQDIWKLLEEPQ